MNSRNQSESNSIAIPYAVYVGFTSALGVALNAAVLLASRAPNIRGRDYVFFNNAVALAGIAAALLRGSLHHPKSSSLFNNHQPTAVADLGGQGDPGGGEWFRQLGAGGCFGR